MISKDHVSDLQGESSPGVAKYDVKDAPQSLGYRMPKESRFLQYRLLEKVYSSRPHAYNNNNSDIWSKRTGLSKAERKEEKKDIPVPGPGHYEPVLMEKRLASTMYGGYNKNQWDRDYMKEF